MTSIDAKLCAAEAAVLRIPSQATVACSGFVGAGHPEAITAALERRFLRTASPRDLTLVYAAGQGDGATRGLNHLAHAGLLRRVIGGHWGLAPRLGQLAVQDKIEAYNFPQGVICQLLRDIAAGRPGCITHVGLNTYVDPIQQGGRLNKTTPCGAVERVELAGQTYLWYKSFPIHVGLIRGTAVDRRGNLIMDREAILGEVLPIAQAAHNHGGIVIAQVLEVRDTYAEPQSVRVPGALIDYIVVAEPQDHEQTFAETFNPAYCSSGEVSWHETTLPWSVRRVIAARACDELKPGAIINLGIGLPEGISHIAGERKLLDQLTLSVESGPIGGMPAGGLSFGAARFPHAIVDQPSQFDFYDGGGLDFAAVGAAQIDRFGNVNVARFGSRVAGVGGFVNITQNASCVAFCGTFTTGNLEVELVDNSLKIKQEGATRKFVADVEQINFSGPTAVEKGQEVLYITERAVFRLEPAGIRLIEYAPGIDIQRDIIHQMDFLPLIGELRPMSLGQ